MAGKRKRWLGIPDAAVQDFPERVHVEIRRQRAESQRLISVLQLGVVLFFIFLAAIQPEQPGAARDVQGEDLVPLVLGGYVLFTLFRLYLAWRERLYPWFQYLSIVVDMALLFALIWSFHIEYGQPPSFYLKAPTLIYVFIFIGLRVLTFEARYVIGGGFAAAAGWVALSAYAVLASGGGEMVTRDYVEYMTSNSILIGAEADKIIAILVVTVILAAAMNRAQRLVVRAATEGEAVRDLRTLLLARGRPADHRLREGGSRRGAERRGTPAIVFCDIRGFTRFSQTVSPGEGDRDADRLSAGARSGPPGPRRDHRQVHGATASWPRSERLGPRRRRPRTRCGGWTR